MQQIVLLQRLPNKNGFLTFLAQIFKIEFKSRSQMKSQIRKNATQMFQM